MLFVITMTGNIKTFAEEKVNYITTEGLFTRAQDSSYKCEDLKAAYDEANPKESTAVGTPNETESEDTGLISKYFNEARMDMGTAAADLMSPQCDPEGFNAGDEFIKVMTPVNITNNLIVMKTIDLTQKIAFLGAIILIVVFAIMYTTGTQVKTNPLQFGIRLFFAMLGVYYLPELMQDVLNLNNVLVNGISSIKWNFVGETFASSLSHSSTVIMFYIGVMAIAMKFFLYGGGILVGIVMLIILYFVIKPVIQIILWWYTRMLMLFFLAIVGPFMVMMLALPQTARMATKWITGFVGTVFEQTFMAIGFFFFSHMVVNIGTFNEMVGIGIIGDIFVVIAMMHFLAGIPRLTRDLIGGISNPGDGAADAIAGATAAMTQKGIKSVSGKAAEVGKTGVKLADKGLGKTLGHSIGKDKDGNDITGGFLEGADKKINDFKNNLKDKSKFQSEMDNKAREDGQELNKANKANEPILTELGNISAGIAALNNNMNGGTGSGGSGTDDSGGPSGGAGGPGTGGPSGGSGSGGSGAPEVGAGGPGPLGNTADMYKKGSSGSGINLGDDFLNRNSTAQQGVSGAAEQYKDTMDSLHNALESGNISKEDFESKKSLADGALHENVSSAIGASFVSEINGLDLTDEQRTEMLKQAGEVTRERSQEITKDIEAVFTKNVDQNQNNKN